jgi:uncharacterized small protein (DUF1192 family)
MTGDPLSITEVNERIAALRDMLGELIAQTAGDSADDECVSDRIAAQQSELNALVRLRDDYYGWVAGPPVDDFA